MFLLLVGSIHEALSPAMLDAYLAPAESANPAAIDGVGLVVDQLGMVEWLLYPLVILGALAALGRRLLRAQGIERQQVKWFVYASSVIVGLFSVATVLNSIDTGSGMVRAFVEACWFTIIALVAIGLPAVVALAILRYRLYDIDRLINRSIVYLVVTVILGSLYLGLIVVASELLQLPTGQSSNLVIAASTLTVAALFRPLRSRVQLFVDRRFYRTRYDASRTIERFASRLREDVDLARITTDLQEVARETMQPEHVSLWLPAPTSVPRYRPSK